jgi:putative methionine-R-sulfoxide reductase with GAF domain
MAPELKLRSALVVPFFVGGRAWGVIDLESEHVEAFAAEDARVVGAVAAQVGSALARLDIEGVGDLLAAT